jgi:hypothetical protein
VKAICKTISNEVGEAMTPSVIDLEITEAASSAMAEKEAAINFDSDASDI